MKETSLLALLQRAAGILPAVLALSLPAATPILPPLPLGNVSLGHRAVIVDTNGAVVAPTNFWQINSNMMNAVFDASGTNAISRSDATNIFNALMLPEGTEALKNWRAFLGTRAAGSNTQIAVTLISDSYGAQGTWTAPFFNAAKTIYGDAGIGFLYARWGDYNYQSAIPVYVGTWTGYDHFDLPMFSTVTSSETNATITWSNQTFSTGKIYFMARTNGGTFTIKTNGTVLKTVSSLAAANALTWTNLTIAESTVDLTLTCLTGTNVMVGADLRTTTPGLRLYNHGHSGAAAISWNDQNPSGNTVQGGGTNALLRVLTNENPGLVIIDLSRNDQLRYGAAGLAGLATNLAAVVQDVKTAAPFADILMLSSPWMSNTGNAVLSSELEPIVRYVALTNGAAYIDMFNNSLTLDNPLFTYASLHTDEFHFNQAGGRQMVDLVAKSLLNSPIETALHATQPTWFHEVNLKAANYGSGFAVNDTDTVTGLSVRNAGYVTSNTSPPIIFSVPHNLGFTRVVATFDLEGFTLATNMSLAIQHTAERPSLSEGFFAVVTGITNSMVKTVSVTNDFVNETGPRSLYVRFLDVAHSGNVTNKVYVNRIRLRSQ